MKEKIQLKHPEGKKAIKMDSDKYEVLKTAMINFLRSKKEATHDEIYHAVIRDFEEKKVKFEGSVEWHMEWVKLDLEARKEIKRTIEKYVFPAIFSVTGFPTLVHASTPPSLHVLYFLSLPTS